MSDNNIESGWYWARWATNSSAVPEVVYVGSDERVERSGHPDRFDQSDFIFLQRIYIPGTEHDSIDTLLRRIRHLESTQESCAAKGELKYECRHWLVMADMLKSKRRFRRDGR